ncbi:uncharacterized protein DUF4142 [Rhizobium azibense]|nr:uncharacterized protein DUF4142 [Rhizobium azibense]
MLDKLKGPQGDDFIKQYHSDQESAHEDAIDLFKRYREGGDNAELKAWAASTRLRSNIICRWRSSCDEAFA